MKKRITRKDFLRLSGAGLSGMALNAMVRGSALAQEPRSDTRPNILFICTDQLRSFADIPETLPLPAHQRLLGEGRGFSNYYVHQAPCGPSRSVIYTGQHVQKTGMYTNPPISYAEDEGGQPAVELPPNFPTVGDLLREQGYYTAYKGKWHLSAVNQKVRTNVSGTLYPNASDALEDYGFSDYNHDGEHSGLTLVGFGHDGFIAADSANLLYDFSRGYAEGRPWFLAVNFINPHDIMFFDATGRQHETRTTPDLIGPMMEAPRIPFYERDWDVPLPRSFYEDDLSTKPSVQREDAASRVFGTLERGDEASWRAYQNYYFNCIRDVDRHIGTVLDALDRFGLADNTIVVFTSDHGERSAAHGMRGKGADIYKETLRVPLIIRHPDVQGGETTDALGCGVDLAPTLLSFAGVTADELARRYPDLHGVDLTPVVGDAGARTERDTRGILFSHMSPGRLAITSGNPNASGQRRGLIRGVYDGRYKFGRYFAATQHHQPRDWETLVRLNDLELYDTASDPDEIVNLAYEPEREKNLILELNSKVNALIDTEVGIDDGSIYPGPVAQYNTLTEG